MAALFLATEWVLPKTDCSTIIVRSFLIKGVEYVAPTAMGSNMSIAEFVVADEQYAEAVKGNPKALQTLAAIMYRPAETNATLAAKQGDQRVKFYHVDEAEQRPQYPDHIHAAALLFFSGVKYWVHNTYGPYIFEEPDTDDNGNPIPTGNNTPNFGWWGILQMVAESQVFGTLEQVYQANLHEICIYLVRKKSEQDALLEAARGNNKTEHDDT
jgi:hypothetical protein